MWMRFQNVSYYSSTLKFSPSFFLILVWYICYVRFCIYLCLCFGEGNGNPLQYSCLENPRGGGAWRAAVHGVPKSQTQLSHFTFTFHFHALEKEMATHSSVLAWRIPGMGEPGGLLSMGSHRVRHDWSNLAAAATAVLKFVFLSVCVCVCVSLHM